MFSARHEYVGIEDAELERLRPPKERALLLEQFVEVDQVEPSSQLDEAG